ncbi:MerR family transcriptional regulator [Candidatus Hydrogenisulfobacillus filiaventi]|uniref:MerR family transcriptional regulator n=1 Tax=Candidatus Hydrogenisulfobacillus filiaventi TaxID=2707344 RepID=A0A6F8ZHK5_9FIRM|nr:MerR family transcriptional regulator [Bacillota bacterium]CAB1129266.1 MerR family transcriptional regulator [Candidatus Hydrogenisulfobacillus filiaventi]
MKEGHHLGPPLYTIGVVRSATGLTERRIRYYEAQHLISPRRTAGNQRLYTDQDIETLKTIKQLLDQGLSLKGVREKLNREVLSTPLESDEVERDADAYFEGKRLARGEMPTTGSLFPLMDRHRLIRRLERDEEPAPIPAAGGVRRPSTPRSKKGK